MHAGHGLNRRSTRGHAAGERNTLPIEVWPRHFFTLRLRKPLLLEGKAGVGKTEIAKVLSTLLTAVDSPAVL